MSLAVDIPSHSEVLPDIPPRETRTLNLSKRQKAAIVVRVLLAEGAEIALSDLPDPLQEELARQMSEMRFVDRATLSTVVEEFLAEIEEIGISFPGGIEGALAMLDGTISAATASRLRKQAGLAFCGDPWGKIGELATPQLVETMAQESIEISAVMLSKLKVAKAAEVLGRLPGDRARRITYAMSQVNAVKPETVRKIGLAMIQQFEAQPATAFSDSPVARVGAILNYAMSATRDEMLAGLDEQDSGFADEVRKEIFTFAHIPVRIAPLDVPKILREIPQETLAIIVSGATGPMAETVEFMLSNMSKRLAETIREEAGEVSPKAREVEEAASSVVIRIRELEAQGEIALLSPDEDEEEE